MFFVVDILLIFFSCHTIYLEILNKGEKMTSKKNREEKLSSFSRRSFIRCLSHTDCAHAQLHIDIDMVYKIVEILLKVSIPIVKLIYPDKKTKEDVTCYRVSVFSSFKSKTTLTGWLSELHNNNSNKNNNDNSNEQQPVILKIRRHFILDIFFFPLTHTMFLYRLRQMSFPTFRLLFFFLSLLFAGACHFFPLFLAKKIVSVARIVTITYNADELIMQDKVTFLSFTFPKQLLSSDCLPVVVIKTRIGVSHNNNNSNDSNYI